MPNGNLPTNDGVMIQDDQDGEDEDQSTINPLLGGWSNVQGVKLTPSADHRRFAAVDEKLRLKLSPSVSLDSRISTSCRLKQCLK